MVDATRKEKLFLFLDELRNSNQMNMFGAPAILRVTFGLDAKEAIDIFREWTKTFEEKN